MAKTVVFRMNGVAHAFLREPGCLNCAQCSAEKPRANTSGSLLIYEAQMRRRLEYHYLFDCGAGVVDSLFDANLTQVSEIFISHNHIDHWLDLDRLVNGLGRSGHALPLPMHCTEGTMEAGPGLFHWLFGRMLAFQPVLPEQRVRVSDSGVGLKVTPVAVYHGPSARAPVIWVIEFGNRGTDSYRKLILGWDMLHLVPPYPEEDRDPHYAGAVYSKNNEPPAHTQLLQDADELFIEGNTYFPHPSTGHTSVTATLKAILPHFRPKRTWIVHYSGHEDPSGPLSDADVQQQIDTDKARYGLASEEIRLARHGMALHWNIP